MVTSKYKCVSGLSITKIFTFAAAHHLPKYKGKCKNVHGHTFKLFVTVKLRVDYMGTKEGMIVDFSELKRIVNYLLEDIDHTDLNKTCCSLPTAENLVGIIKKKLDDCFLNEPFYLSKLRLHESETSYAEWEESK